MSVRGIIGDVFVIISIVFVMSSIISLALNRPILFSYAISESMEPTIGVGDLFFINPFSKGEKGSIVVFRMDGMYVVHRIYAEEDGGYITKGDNNIATDQLNGKHSAVKKGDIIGEVVTFAGKPVVIVKAGRVINALHSNSIFLAIALITLGFLSLGGKGKRKKSRKKIRISSGLFYGFASSVLILSLVASTMLSWGEVSFSYASTVAGGQREGWYIPGSEFEKSIEFKNRAYYPVIFFFKESGVNGELVSDSKVYLSPREKTELRFHVNVPEDTRIYSDGVVVYAYLPLLPLSVTEELFSVSPYLPLIVQIGILLVVLTALYIHSGFGEEYIVLRRRLKI